MTLIIAITGATGTLYAVKLLEALQQFEHIQTHLVMSKWAVKNLEIETDYSLEYVQGLASIVHEHDNLAASIASGSFKTDGI